MNVNQDSCAVTSRCDPATDKLALALAAQAWPDAERAAHWQALGELIHQGRAKEIILLAARQGDRPLAALVAQMLVGKSAVVWPPQFTIRQEGECRTLAAQLLAQLDGELRAGGVQLAQALLPSGQTSAANLLEHAGFAPAGDLLYLSAPYHSFPDHPPQLPFKVEPFDPAQAGRLIQLVDRTYEGTLDCPRLDGLRETADVLLGYQAVGEFRPEHWQIASHGGKDVGCLLVNLHPGAKQAEIVYTGLIPEVRGRGWGLEMTRHAQWLARAAQCEQVVLAVDAANSPAIRMYAASGFSQWDRRSLWLRSTR